MPPRPPLLPSGRASAIRAALAAPSLGSVAVAVVTAVRGVSRLTSARLPRDGVSNPISDGSAQAIVAAVTTPQGTIIPFPSFGGGGELRFAVAHRVISFAGLVDAALVRLLAR